MVSNFRLDEDLYLQSAKHIENMSNVIMHLKTIVHSSHKMPRRRFHGFIDVSYLNYFLLGI